MKIAIYGKHFSSSFAPAIQFLLNHLKEGGADLIIYHPFCKFLFEQIQLPDTYEKYKDAESLAAYNPDILLCIGGDGTILDSVSILGNSDTPTLGINTGRLGFLSSIAREEIAIAVKAILAKDYTIEKRSLLCLKTPRLFEGSNFALNELTVMKKESSSMITVHTFIDGQYLNSYWADGLIIATPTGSTAYSLSCGGPILVPGVPNIIITPISPHNLNVRPIVIRDDSEIKLKIEGRDDKFMLALDSRSVGLSNDTEIVIKKASFYFHLAKLNTDNFYHTLRNKMMWGLDKRN